MCFDDPKNADKVPTWYTRKRAKNVKTETGMITPDYDVVLMAGDIGFLPSMKLLSDPNVWIADTGASVDSTTYAVGCKDVISEICIL